MKNARIALKSLIARSVPSFIAHALRKAWWARRLSAQVAVGEPEFAVVRRLVGAGDSVVDVGANLGVYTALLSQCVGDAGTVSSLEPIPLTFDVLRSNVHSNDLSNVELLPFAASDETVDRTMWIPRWEEGHENFYQARIGDDVAEGSRQFTVRCRRLDELLASRTRPVTFVKIDVEGHEEACLRGAAELLRQDRPALLVEVAGDPNVEGTSASRVFTSLAAMGYEAYEVRNGVLRRFEPGDKGLNWFFLAPDHVARLDVQN